MHMQQVMAVICGFFLTIALSNAARAGVVLNISATEFDKQGSPQNNMQLYFSNGFIKMVANEATDTVYSQSANNMTIIMHQEKAYMVLDRHFASSMQNQMDKAMAEALAKMPPEQRAMAEKMMEQTLGQVGRGAAPIEKPEKTEIRKTSRSDTINGFDCVYYESFKRGQKNREYCVTPWDKLGTSEDIRGSVVSMTALMEEVFSELSKMAPVQMDSNPFDDIMEINGFPVLTRRFEGDRIVDEASLTSVSEKALGDAYFRPPNGYQQRAMGMR
ncbi:MAG: hypothetical protein HOC23_17480 [Halieaceae bacterium]|jgi:hypothetical protein|nr:hypothetical protein [Halieaceae bacterium]